MRITAILCLALNCAWSAENIAFTTDDQRALIAHMLEAYVFIANGSGVIISADGLMLTNNHVIDHEGKLEARLANGDHYPVKLLGTDPVGDISLLQIQADKPLPFAELGDEKCLRPGMDVFAIGNPFGLGDMDDTPTLTRGVLSTSRIVREDYTDALQLDAPVNPGNSGGPSFDADGHVLGINGQIRTLSGMRINSGVGLAIACTQLSAFVPVLKAADGGYAHHTTLPKNMELKQQGNAVTFSSDAEPVRAGDKLISVAGRPVISLSAAAGIFDSLPWTPGCEIPAVIERDGAKLDIRIPAARKTIPGKPYHGLSIDQSVSGVVIELVDDNSPAKSADIKVGDLVLEANGKAIVRKLDFLKVMVKLEIGDWLELKLRSAEGLERTVKLLLRDRD